MSINEFVACDWIEDKDEMRRCCMLMMRDKQTVDAVLKFLVPAIQDRVKNLEDSSVIDDMNRWIGMQGYITRPLFNRTENKKRKYNF